MTTHYAIEPVSLDIQRMSNKLLMDVSVPQEYAHTSAFPHTVSVLQKVKPSVLHTTCYNPDNLPFKKEAEKTEIAHLLEHIILDLLAEKSFEEKGAVSVSYSGKTRWDWLNNPIGTFEIELSVAFDEQPLLDGVIPEALEILKKILFFDKKEIA